MYAITPRGVGKKVGARAIEDEWPLEPGETFKSDAWAPNMVLAEDGQSLRPGTEAELAPPTVPPPPETAVLYDHENRIRVMEGQPPLTLDDFLRKQQG